MQVEERLKEQVKEHIAVAQELTSKVANFLVEYSFQVIGAIIVLFVGVNLSKWLPKLFVKFCKEKNLDITITNFFAGVLKILILAFAAIVALGNFGITIAPFVAAIGAVAFGGTMAIQGPLSNYGAGISLLLTRPFKVGDTIIVREVSGTVEDIKLAYTVLRTEDQVQITIPNKQIVGEILHNSTTNRVVETTVGISYADDPERAIAVIQKVLGNFSQIVAQSVPQIGIREFGASSIVLDIRYWTLPAHCMQTMHAVNLAIFKAFREERITIPFPQQEIRVLGADSSVASMYAGQMRKGTDRPS